MNKTPYFTFNKKIFDRNLKEFEYYKTLGIEILYALKANNYPEIVKEVINRGNGFDVASKEEIELGIKYGVDPQKIAFSSPSKEIEDIKYANKVGVRMYAADSIVEIEKIKKYAPDREIFLRIGVPSKSAAFDLSDKFGMPTKYVLFIFKKYKGDKQISGISFHVGSQNTDTTSWKRALDITKVLINEARKFDIEITSINLGGGIPAKYTNNVKPLKFYIRETTKYIRNFKRDFPKVKLYVEPGRSLVANTMKLHTSVIDIKDYKKPPVIITNTSVFGGVIEALEGFEYPITSKTSSKKKYFRIGGYSCDGYDIIRKRVLLPTDTKIGDIITIEQAGAYTNVFEKFQLKPFPKITNL